MNAPSIDRREWGLALAVSLAALALTLVPVIVGYARASPDARFLGVATNLVDANSYFSLMRQALSGHWLFSNYFTPEPVPFLMFRPVFLVMGWLTAFLSPEFVFHLFRVIFGLAFLLYAYRLISLFFAERRRRLAAFLILVFSSGFGFFVHVAAKSLGSDYRATDSWVFGSVTFLSLMEAPHFAASLFFMVAAVYHLLRSLPERLGGEPGPLRHAIIAGLFGLLLGFEHGFDVITLYAMLGLFFVLAAWLSSRRVISLAPLAARLAVFGLISVPSLVYTVYLFSFVPAFAEWNKQNVLVSPGPDAFILGYGFLGLLAALYVAAHAVRHLRSRERPTAFSVAPLLLFAWVLAAAVLLYIPFNIQRRFAEGLHIPVAVLAGLGLMTIVWPWLVRKLRVPEARRRQAAALGIALFLLATVPSNLQKVGQQVTRMATGGQSRVYITVDYFAPIDEIEALRWLEANAPPESVVLSGPAIGSMIPRFTDARAFLGHWSQTIGFKDKERLYRRFFPTTGARRKAIIGEYGIDFIYVGREETALGADPAVLDTEFVKLYEKGGVRVYSGAGAGP